MSKEPLDQRLIAPLLNLAVMIVMLTIGFSFAGDSEDLVTETFLVPPGFLNGLGTDIAADPFSNVPEGNFKGQIAGPSTREFLEQAGVQFPPGATAIYFRGANKLLVRNTREQLDLVELTLQEIRICLERQVHIVSEFIEVEGALFQDWMFKNRIFHDGTDLRKQVQQWVKARRATILETSLVTCRSGNRARTESVKESIFPTEMDPPEIPTEVNLDGEATKAPRSACSSTACETRSVGSTFEIDIVLGADSYTIDTNLSPEIVSENGYTDWPAEGDPFFTLSMPRFHTMKVTTQVSLTDGRYAILGTHKPLKASDPKRANPIVIQFLRADIETLPIR